MRISKKDTLVPVMLGILVILGASVPITAAYMTDHALPMENVFTPGTVEVDLKEDNWREEDGDDLHPGETVSKDPVVYNRGSHPAYVFLEVTVPAKNIRTVDEHGRKTEAAVRELCSFQADHTKWSLIRSSEHTNGNVYVYGYQELLEPGEETVPLFQEITTVNYLEGELDPSEIQVMHIQAKAIQGQIDAANLTMEQMYELLLSEQ